MTRRICAGTLVEFQADVTKLTGVNPSNPEDDKTASFQRRAPFAINPLVAAWRKPLNFRGFDASDAGLMGPDPKVSSTEGGGNSTSFKNFVYTPLDTYQVKDSFWNWHFRAVKVYARTPSGGGTCDVMFSDVRRGFLGMTKNIIAAGCT